MTAESNAYVERFHRSLGHEWGPRPSAWDPASRVQEVTEQFLLHYNQQRPHQGRWLSQPTATGGLPGLPDVAYSSRDGGS